MAELQHTLDALNSILEIFETKWRLKISRRRGTQEQQLQANEVLDKVLRHEGKAALDMWNSHSPESWKRYALLGDYDDFPECQLLKQANVNLRKAISDVSSTWTHSVVRAQVAKKD